MGQPIEITFSVKGADAEEAIKKLREEVGAFGEQAEKSGKSTSNFGANLGGWVTTAKEAINVITQVVAGVRAFAEELDRQTAILGSFSGSVEEAQERTSGLVSALDLMTASNNAAQAGLALNERQLANVAVAATQYAEATGDASISTESLARAIAAGEAGPLRKLGISLEGITGQEEKQAEALRQLEELYGDVSVEADNLGDHFTQLDVAVDDTTTSFYESFGASEDLNRALGELGAALSIELKDGFDIGAEAGGSFAAMMSLVADGVTATVNSVKALADGDFGTAASEAQRALGLFGEATVGNILAEVTGNSSFNNQFMDRVRANREDTAAARTERATRTPTGAAGRGGRGRGRGGGGGDEDLSPTGSFTDFFSDLDERNLSDAAERDRGRDEEMEKFLEEREEHAQALIDYQDELNQRKEESIALASKELEIEQAKSKEAQRQIGQAMEMGKTLLTSVGAPKALLELWEGFSQAAEVPGAYPDGFGMAQHALSAGLHFANAARMGAGGGGQVPAPSAGGSPAARAIPLAGPGRGSGGGNTINHFNAPFSESDLGVLYREADRASQARYDS